MKHTPSFPIGTRRIRYAIAPATKATLLRVMVAKGFANESVALARLVRNACKILCPVAFVDTFTPALDDEVAEPWRPGRSTRDMFPSVIVPQDL